MYRYIDSYIGKAFPKHVIFFCPNWGKKKAFDQYLQSELNMNFGLAGVRTSEDIYR